MKPHLTMLRTAAPGAPRFLPPALWLVLLGAPLAPGADEIDLQELFQKGIPKSPFIAPVYAYGAASLEEGAAADQDLLRLLYFLGELSSDAKYSGAADRSLGELLSSPAQELAQPWLLWGKAFQLDPVASRRRALELAGREPAGTADARHDGWSLRGAAEGWARTGDPAFLSALEGVLARWKDPRWERPEAPGAPRPAALLSLAIDADGAARRAPEPLRTRLGRLAARIDALFLALPHDPRGLGGFATRASGANASTTPLWEAANTGEDGETTAEVALLCVSRYENTGQAGFLKLLLAAADAYLAASPRAGAGSDEVVPRPRTLGLAISLELAAYRATARPAHYRCAFELGELALAKAFDKGGPGKSTLALALAELHLLTLHITAVRAPANTAAR